MKRKYKFLGSIAAITCMTAAVAISVTNCGSGGGGIDDFVWTGSINKEWKSLEQMANNQFATTKSSPVDYTLGDTMTNPEDPSMINAVSKVLGDTGTPEEQKKTWHDAFMQNVVDQLGQGYRIANDHFDPEFPDEDITKYNENWEGYFERNFTAADFADYKVSFDLTPGNGNKPAMLNNFHQRLTFIGSEWYEGELYEFNGVSDQIQITPNAPLWEVRNAWDESNPLDNLSGLVNQLELSFGSYNTKNYFHIKQYNNDEILKDDDDSSTSMLFYENFPTFYGSTFPTGIRK